jgi:hypothetical protein
MPYGTVNADVIQTSTSGGILGAGNASIMKNRIQNGAMVIDQRNAGAAQTGKTSGSYYLDRWQTIQNFGTVTIQQSTTAPTGFSNSFYTTVTTANASPGSTAIYTIDQAIEGFNTSDLSFGTANAKIITLSFWVRSSITGTYCVYFRNSAQDRFYVAEYTISSANTFEQKSITLTGDTTGTWVGATNGVGLELGFSLGLGSGRTGTAGAWTSSAIYGTSNQTNLVGTVNSSFYITGVQLEVGSSATGYEYRLYNQELSACQRYYEQWTYGSGYGTIVVGQCESTTLARGYLTYTVQKRAAPTIATSGTQTNINATGTNLASTYTFIQTTPSTSYMYGIVSSGLVAGNATQFVMNSANAYISFSAEL